MNRNLIYQKYWKEQKKKGREIILVIDEAHHHATERNFAGLNSNDMDQS